MTDWSEYARRTVAEVAATIPDTATLKERRAIISAAYPFGERAMWPYKTWLKATKAYLSAFEEGGSRKVKPTGLEHLPRDPVTGRPMI